MKINSKIFVLLAPLLFASVHARVLVIVEDAYYAANSAQLSTFINDISAIEGKIVQLEVYAEPSGSLRDKCSSLRQILVNAYQANHHHPSNVNDLEGAVFIGNLPTPMFITQEGNVPIDYYYMDIWEKYSDARYAINQDPWGFDAQANMFTHCSFTEDPVSHVKTYYYYNEFIGDFYLDIWITRIMAHQLDWVRKGTTELDEPAILNDYLKRTHERMTNIAKMPSRGFVMGGCPETAYEIREPSSIYKLNLPFYAEFKAPGQSSPANWMSQLQAGPKGNINYGGFNGQRFPKERNERNCIYASMQDPVTGLVWLNLDDKGWEWAGANHHSFPQGHAFNLISGCYLDGHFGSQTVAPVWNDKKRVVGSGYNNGYYVWDNTDAMPDPWGVGFNKKKEAIWEKKLAFQYSGNVNVYLHYKAFPQNAKVHVVIRLVKPEHNVAVFQNDVEIDQRIHKNEDVPGSNWEYVATPFYNPSFNLRVSIDAAAISGDIIIDAIKVVQGSTTYYIDDQDPAFCMTDWRDRSFLDMQDEDITNHAAYSKTHFFLTNACHINEYQQMNCLGLLYAMAHNGLISLGTSNNNYQPWTYSTFTTALAAGDCFGEAFRKQANSYFSDKNNGMILKGAYCMFGAGTLRAQPYITYPKMIASKTITNTQTEILPSNSPADVSNVTVTSIGNYAIDARMQIRLLPETILRQGAVVSLKVH